MSCVRCNTEFFVWCVICWCVVCICWCYVIYKDESECARLKVTGPQNQKRSIVHTWLIRANSYSIYKKAYRITPTSQKATQKRGFQSHLVLIIIDQSPFTLLLSLLKNAHETRWRCFCTEKSQRSTNKWKKQKKLECNHITRKHSTQ